MKTELLTIPCVAGHEEEIAHAAALLREGALVALPTETVYGLGADALNGAAVAGIYEAKGRPSDNPLIIHVPNDLSWLSRYCRDVPELAWRLAERFWPGPLTMILRRAPCVPDRTTGGLDTVAVRFPSNKIAQALITAAGGFVAAPSANTSGRPSPTTAAHVEEDLGERIDCILDGGMVDIGLESTIVDFTEETPMILRPGYLNQKRLEEILGEVKVDPGILAEQPHVRPKAPGMRYKHYAPKAELTIVEGSTEKVVSKIRDLTKQQIGQGVRVGIICTDETRAEYPEGDVKSIGARADEASIARHLYGILREFDDDQVEIIYSEAFDTPDMGQAIMNRLLKAAGHKLIEA